MRGKISYYNENTHIGMIVDKAKVAYEFKLAIWFDQHRLPTANMYVDFKADKNGKVEQIKESALLKLQRKYDVTENDFWQSVDEEALEDLAVARREKLINDRILNIVPKAIAEDYSIADCFLAFFADSVELIYRYEEIAFSDIPQSQRLDYFKLKRFMLKAKSQLLQTDGSISGEPFSRMEKEFSELEFVVSEVLKQKSKDMQTLFNEIYLTQQINFLRVERRLGIDSQRVFELGISVKRADESISMWQNKLKAERNADNIASLQAKIARLVESQESAATELKEIEKNKNLFAEHIQQFKNAKYKEFMQSFGFETELKGVVDALRTVIEHVAFKYDILLWEGAINSNIVRNTFYKQTTSGNFCTATFLRYYLKPLNKNALNKNDEALSSYLAKYDKYIAKQVLILSENKEIITDIMMTVYGNYKDSVVHQFHRAVDSLHWFRANRAAIALFDEQNRTLSPEELAESYAKAHPRERFGIVVFNSKNSSTTKFSENIEIVRLGGLYSTKEINKTVMRMLADIEPVFLN